MTILITGASGFIGSTLFTELSAKHNVYGIGRENQTNRVFNCDLADLDQTIKTLNANSVSKVEVIIHLASVLAKPDNLNDIEVLNRNNILSNNIALLAQHLQASKFINFSSSSVYPNIDGEFFEDSNIDPSVNADGIYGLSKFNAEVILNKLIRNQSVLTHLRCSMVYGEGVNPTRIWPVMEKELEEKNTITVYGNGKRLINQIHVSSLTTIMEKFLANTYPGVYNICDETLSLKDLALRIIKEKGNSESRIIEVEKGNSYRFKMNSDKYKSLN